MKKVQKLLGVLDKLKTDIDQAELELMEYISDEAKQASDSTKVQWKLALRTIQDVEKRRSEAVKVLTKI